MGVSKRERRQSRQVQRQDQYKICPAQHKVDVRVKSCPACGDTRFLVLAWMPESIVREVYQKAQQQIENDAVTAPTDIVEETQPNANEKPQSVQPEPSPEPTGTPQATSP